jgi:hypothetical protein
MMIDYDITSGDVTLSGGDIVMIDGPQSVAQRLEQKFRLWRGEWFLDIGSGFPWLESVMGQRPRPEVLRSLVSDLVSSDPDIRAMTNLDLDFDGVDRRLRIAFNAVLSDGTTQNMEFTV